MKRNFLIYAIIFLAGVLAGWAGGRFINVNKVPAWLGGSQPAPEQITSLSGSVLAVKANSLEFKTWLREPGNVMAVQKEALVSAATAIYLLTPKTPDDVFGQDYNNKLINLSDAIREAQAQKNTALVKQLVAQSRALSAEATQVKNQEIRGLEEKIAALPDGSADREVLQLKLAELNSNFTYSRIKLSEIKPEAVITVWADEDLSGVDKFKAVRIEVKQ